MKGRAGGRGGGGGGVQPKKEKKCVFKHTICLEQNNHQWAIYKTDCQ